MPENDPKQQVKEALDNLRQLRNGLAGSAKQLDGLAIPGELREKIRLAMQQADSHVMMAHAHLHDEYGDQK